jgi:prepilin-type processing-associated H-X9-DG protein
MTAWTAWMALWEGSARLGHVEQPSTTLLVAENSSSWYSSRDPVHWATAGWPDGNIAWTRHQGGANYGFCDGHVKWMTRHQTYFPQCMWWASKHDPTAGCGGAK